MLYEINVPIGGHTRDFLVVKPHLTPDTVVASYCSAAGKLIWIMQELTGYFS